MITDLRELQFSNAPPPIATIESGIETDSREVLPSKAFSGIVSVHPNSMLEPLPMGPAVFSWVHPAKEPSPTTETEPGMITDLRELQ